MPGVSWTRNGRPTHQRATVQIAGNGHRGCHQINGATSEFSAPARGCLCALRSTTPERASDLPRGRPIRQHQPSLLTAQYSARWRTPMRISSMRYRAAVRSPAGRYGSWLPAFEPGNETNQSDGMDALRGFKSNHLRAQVGCRFLRRSPPPAPDSLTCVGPLWEVLADRQSDRGDSDRCDFRHLLRAGGCIILSEFGFARTRSGVRPNHTPQRNGA